MANAIWDKIYFQLDTIKISTKKVAEKFQQPFFISILIRLLEIGSQ